MRHRSSLALLVLGLALGSAGARAADLIEEPIVEPVPVEETFGGWYIRGDAGYVFESETSGDYAFWNQGDDGFGGFDPAALGIDEIAHYDSIKLRGSGSIGVGAGYRFSDQFRADVTLDRFKADVDGRSDCGYLVEKGYGISPVNSGCHYRDSSEATVWTAMANAYVDLAHFGAVTPYLGAGVGAAHVKYDEMKNETFCGYQAGCATAPGYTSPNAPIYTGVHGGYANWRFAASLMAGASVDITHNLKLDAGYRYTRVSKGDAFGFDEADTKSGAEGVQGKDHGFDIHALRAGVRYEFN